MEVDNIKKQMDNLKSKLKQMNKVFSLKQKNERYKNDELFREEKKKKALDYYYRVVKPTRVTNKNSNEVVLEAVEKPIDVISFNQAYE